MSLPIGMHRRAFSYDDALENPMPPPPADMGKLPWKPTVPQRQERDHYQVEVGGTRVSSPTITVSSATDGPDPAPVVKAKATHVIMNSLITKQTQENIQRFEQQAGLREAGYTPHKGLTTEETKYLRMAEALRKLKLQSGESSSEEKSGSAQSTPSSTPTSSPRPKSRGWFASGVSPALPGPNPSPQDGGSGEKDKWSLFAPRTLQRSESAGAFTTQPYQGGQKASPMELIQGPATFMAGDTSTLKPPKLDLPGTEAKKQRARSHNIKPRDLNVFTPTGF
ncbi:putative monooxygenase p33MONOX [Sorex fumeus]|uniref:putative monooxygenase p33MONOX n=1 Tax=Sorex fumeus TaxID=62283 RepID=UPI0024ACDA48|nr:putative monooxygenase p33MONOX [Sorex fumeus]XP_055969108.1 putative monooxygenase p33MONOX [Sorex fumeus]